VFNGTSTHKGQVVPTAGRETGSVGEGAVRTAMKTAELQFIDISSGLNHVAELLVEIGAVYRARLGTRFYICRCPPGVTPVESYSGNAFAEHRADSYLFPSSGEPRICMCV